MPEIDTIDSHAHLFPRWFSKTDRVAQEAMDHRIAVISSAISPDQYKYGVEFAKKHENVFISLGLAPQGIIRYGIDYQAALDQLMDFSGKIVAIGEVGLDYHWVKDQKGREVQRKAFLRAIEIANDLQLPIVIHSRKAETDCLDILKNQAQTDVILHCFAGNIQQAKQCTNLGWYISIPTAVTRRKVFRRLAEVIPLENLLVETDSPFLSPDPRIRTNTPLLISHAIREVSLLKDTPYEEVKRITFRNCDSVFRLDLS